LKTRFTDLVGARLPIVLGGMGSGVSNWRLASVAAKAGVVAFIGTAKFQSERELEVELQQAIDTADGGVIGTNISLFPGAYSDPMSPKIAARISREMGIEIVETSGRSPGPYLDYLKEELGLKVLHKSARIRDALSAQRHGVDAVSIVGYEEGGHPGPDHVGTLVQVREAASKLDIPLVAGGGLCDGEGVAAMLALGADAALLGTRFMATTESPVHERVKEALVDAHSTDTVIVFSSYQNDTRVLRTELAEAVLALEAEGVPESEVIAFVGKNGPKERLYTEGDFTSGLLACGQGVGLIDRVLPMSELVWQLESSIAAVGERISAISDDS
jgi:NADH:quinone reductase (non-electrogenic)